MKKITSLILFISLFTISCSKQNETARNTPDYSKAYEFYKKGRTHFLMFTKKDAAIASRYFDKAIKIKPDFALAMAANAEALSYFSFQLERNGKSSKNTLKKAFDMIKAAMRINKNLYECKRALAWCYFAANLYKSANKFAKLAAAQNPDDSEAAFLIWATENSNNSDDSRLKKALKSNIIIALINAGSLARRQGNYAVAIDYFERVIKLVPTHSHAYVNIGNVYVRQRNPEKAIEYYTKALKMQKNDSYIYFNFAAAYVGLRDYEKAKEYYNKALKINPNLIPAHKMLMKLYKKVYKDSKKYAFHKQRVAIILNEMKLNYIEKLKIARETL
jgi:tetratricopeptide (TPR) repeat protein